MPGIPKLGLPARVLARLARLAEEATENSALLFSHSLLMYSTEIWEPVRSPSIRVSPEDLIAFYGALQEGAPLVLLPFGWSSVTEKGQ